MLIRDAEEKDLPVILEIMNDAILNSTAIYDYKARDLNFVQKWFEKKKSENFPVLVYEEENKTMGFASYGTFRGWEAYKFSVEHSIYVHEQFRKKGIGTKLLNAIISKAAEDGYHTMIAGIDSSNEKSILLHEKAGFVIVGNFKQVGFKFNRWLDLTFMQLMLD